MNFKIFSIIVGILVTVILILGGTYYYLFEYSKPDYTAVTQNSNEQNRYTSTNTYTTTQNSYVSDTTNINNNIDLNLTQSNQNSEQNETIIDNKVINNAVANKDTNQTFTDSDNNKSVIEKNQNKKQNNENKLAAIEKEINKQKKILEQEKTLKSQNTNKNNKTNHKAKKLSPAQEYLSLGKNSRLEPQLSTENMKVYVLDGKFLSDYRIKLLKDMLTSIEDNSKDYFLSVFVKMLPKGEMNLTIYNKDIIFSDMKKAYKYISIDKISPYVKTPEMLNQYVAREEIIERLKFQIKTQGKGSDFSKHINSLKAGLDTAQYFFPFCEIIEITSVK
ncbi:TPA: hypothetical protein R1670_001470 [Campylobacter coli]|nr:hypothetical protein [Campylobacter coli]HEF1918998.1 hypothetical protein [Campylobacter coli]